jgi:hypothetical protein
LCTEIHGPGSIPDPPGHSAFNEGGGGGGGGGGGSGISFPPKNPFLPFCLNFTCFSTLSSKSISGQTETNFKNPREVFAQNGMRNKTLFQFLQRSYEKRYSKTSSRPIFPYFPFSVSVPILQELSRPAGDEFGKTEGGFCLEHAHIQ